MGFLFVLKQFDILGLTVYVIHTHTHTTDINDMLEISVANQITYK
jgi:hypothetical protein